MAGVRLTELEAIRLGLIPPGKTNTRLRNRYQRAMATDAPQAILQRILTEKWPGLAIPEYQGAVPGRKFRIDVAFPEVRLAVECDGWEHHGRYKDDFQRDRERDRLMLLNGWRVLRFYASEIKKSPVSVIETVASALLLCAENS